MTNDIVTQWGRQAVDPVHLDQLAREGVARKRGPGAKLAILAVVCLASFAPALGLAAANGGLQSPDPGGLPRPAVVAPVVAPETALEDAEPDLVIPVTVVAQGPEKAKRSPRRAKRSCSVRKTEIHGTDVRICDRPRTANRKPRLWEPIAKPSRLAARDLPSPSGLLD